MTEAIAHALREELERERYKRPLAKRLEELAQETMAMAGPNPRDVTKEEIDELLGAVMSADTIASIRFRRALHGSQHPRS